MSKYNKTIKGVTFDVYDVLRAFEVTSPAIQHAVKKLLMPGVRGHKDQLQDVQEAAQSIQREIEYLTSIKPEKTIKEQLLEAVIDRSWLRADLFQPKNHDFLYDVKTYGGQEFRSEPLHKWTFGNWHDQNSVKEWRETIEPAKPKEAKPNSYAWTKNTGQIPIDCDIVDIVLFTAESGEVDIVECTDADIWGWSLNDTCQIVLYRPAKL
jgi:FMN phosphatase YigB (HAD superfamily)